jgi:ABC-type Na+ efflux pump permease subunit
MLGLTVFARWQHDRFVGLIRFVIRVFKVSPDLMNADTVLAFLSPGPQLLIKLVMAMSVLMVGMTLLLVLIIVVSAHVKSVEEAAMVQGPFYLGLLALYYVSLGLLNPQSLETGWGKILSLLPVGSMLLMGMRILNGTVRSTELIFAMGSSVLVLGVLIGVGYPIYRRGLIRQ